MAEYTGITANGVRYIIDTRYAAAPGTPEYARICEEQHRAAHRILVHAAQRAKEENHEQRDGVHAQGNRAPGDGAHPQ